MKHIALGTVFALSLSVVSWSAIADEQSPEHDKATMEDKCRAMGEQHGMKGDKMEGWMKKCMDIVMKMREEAHSDDDGGEQDSQDGDSDMGGESDSGTNDH